VDAGKMPVLERLIGGGTTASLATLHPVLSPMLWTSIATGMRPFKHGILGFTEPTEDGSGIRPVTSLSRRVKAIWNILSQEGLRSNVVGWWPSHPAEPIRGVMVSNHYHGAVGPIDQPLPLAPGTVSPPRLARTLAELRVHPNELVEEDILPFIPRIAEVDQDGDPRVATCLKTLAECVSIHSAATWLMENEPWDFMAVYYDAIDHFSHGFMRYHPPRQDHIAPRDFEVYQGVVEAAYRFHDEMLGRLLELAGHDTTVMLVSDHGFHPDHLRPSGIPLEPAGPAVEHRDFGILALQGPEIRRDELIHGTTLLDVTPTVLALFGLPVGEDMDGRPLLECFVEPREMATLPSWEEIEGDAGLHVGAVRLDPLESQAAVEQLVALGYIEPPDANRGRAVANTLNEIRFDLARSYMDADRHGEAVPILEELVAREPAEYRFGIQLAMCYRAMERISELRSLVDAMTSRRREEAVQARARLRELSRTIRARRAEREEPGDSESGRSTGRAPRKAGSADPGEALVTEGERQELGRLRALVRLDTYALDYLMGYAERAFGRAVDIDSANPHAHLGLARSHLPRRRNRLAAEEALQAVALLYPYPLAHFWLGVALHRMGRIPRAVQALEVAVALNPNFREAHLRLARIYQNRLHDDDKATEHRMLAAQLRDGDREEIATRPRDDAERRPPSDARPTAARAAPPARHSSSRPVAGRSSATVFGAPTRTTRTATSSSKPSSRSARTLRGSRRRKARR
jgi:Tfp pilus assembly protein PilF